MEDKKTDLLKLLLRPEAPDVQKERPTARYEVKRLSELLGEPVVFQLRGLSYGQVEELKGVERDSELKILLAGCVEPNWKAPELQEKFGTVTPAETVKALLLPGEIGELSREVERLCGFRKNSIREIKNA